MKTMKRNRLRQLVSWGYITQPEANQLWRDYLQLFNKVRQIETGLIIAQVSNQGS